MKQLLALVLSLALLFSLLITVLTALNRLAPPTAAAIIDVNGLQQSPPCWYGVCPGQSTLGDVETVLPKNASSLIGAVQPDLPEYDGRPPSVRNLCVDILATKGWQACFYQQTSSSPDSKFIEPVTLWSDQDSLRLGDVISVLGMPEATFVCRLHLIGLSYEDWRSMLVFKGNIVVNGHLHGPDTGAPPDPNYFSPQMSVESIIYSAALLSADRNEQDTTPWIGFTLRNQPDLVC